MKSIVKNLWIAAVIAVALFAALVLLTYPALQRVAMADPSSSSPYPFHAIRIATMPGMDVYEFNDVGGATIGNTFCYVTVSTIDSRGGGAIWCH